MPTRLSEILGISRDDLEKRGVYDSMVDYDSKLHIDPALIGKCKAPEFKNSVDKIATYFSNTLRVLVQSKAEGDKFWKTAVKRMTFGEGLNTGLGYSQNGTAGSGIGPDTAERIIATIKQVLDAGTNDPAIFELVPILEDRIGPDRISDMFSAILADELRAYTARISKELNVPIPQNPQGQEMVFVPKVILSDLPTAEMWEDVSIAAQYNQGVRDTLNDIIGKTWKKLSADLKKEELRNMLLSNPVMLQELLELYKKRGGKEYNFVLDHLGIMLWDVVGPKAADDYPLDLSPFKKITSDNVLDLVLTVCGKYKDLIENNGLVEPLYDSNGDRRPERFPQLLFYAVADSYCTANELDLSREINAGSGALDFKMSSGLAKVTIELKYSSNPKLVEGYEKQLPTYNAAEKVQSKYSVYLVLRVNDKNDHKIEAIKAIIKERERKGEQSPALVVVDAIIKPSASKR